MSCPCHVHHSLCHLQKEALEGFNSFISVVTVLSVMQSLAKRIFVYELVYCMNGISTSTQLVEAIAFTFKARSDGKVFSPSSQQPLHSLFIASILQQWNTLDSLILHQEIFQKNKSNLPSWHAQGSVVVNKELNPLPWFPFFSRLPRWLKIRLTTVFDRSFISPRYPASQKFGSHRSIDDGRVGTNDHEHGTGVFSDGE